MYDVLLAIHNILRWVVLIVLIVTVVRAVVGWLGKRDWLETDSRLVTFSTMGIDIQLLLGLLLYIFFSPLALEAITNQGFSFVMENSEYRFFAIEHGLLMLLAVVFGHLGSILSKRVVDSTARFRRATIWFGLALLAILAGIPWERAFFPGL
jgi:hypothetical protein